MPEDEQNTGSNEGPTLINPETVVNPEASVEPVSAETPTTVPPSAVAPESPAPLSPNPVATSTPTPIATATPTNNKKKLGLLLAVVAGILVFTVGSAGAYLGVILPNKPENVLKQSIANTFDQKKTKFDGKLSYESTDENATLKAVNVTFKGDADLDKNAFSSEFEITAAGAKVLFEMRHLDKSVFVKIGDLNHLRGFVAASAPEFATTFDSLNKKVANQWLEIDETLLKQANADCALNTNFTFTKDDINLLNKRYDEVPFANIKSNSKDTVNGRGATKFEIEIDDDKGAEFGKGLGNLSIVKKIKECDKNASTDSSGLADHDKTPLTIWVDKSTKQIVKLAGKSSAKDEQKSKFKANFEITMQYGNATVTKPEGAKPLMEVLGDFGQLLGLGGSSINASYESPDSSLSPQCMKEIQDYSNSGGTKPVPTCL